MDTGVKALLYGFATNVLLGILLYGINIFIQIVDSDQAKLYGSIILSLLSILILYTFIWKWNNVRTRVFYFVFIPLFLTSSFDLFDTLEVLIAPTPLAYLKKYLEANDHAMGSIVSTVYAFFDGTILQAINFTALYRMSIGKSIRTLLMIPAMSLCFKGSVFVLCTLTSQLHLEILKYAFMPTIMIYMVLIPYRVLKIPRSFSLLNDDESSVRAKFLAIVTLPLHAAAGIVIIAKAMVLKGDRNDHVDIVRFNDPLISLNDVKDTFPFIAGVIWLSVVLSLPLIAISCVYHFKTSKPTFLWDVAIINLAFVLTSQFIFVVGSLFWRTPEKLRADPTNATFWAINLVPVVAAVVQVTTLLSYGFPVEFEPGNEIKLFDRKI